MKFSVFTRFVAPSFALMVTLILLPLLGGVWLSLHQERTETKIVKTVVETPLFGGMVRKTEKEILQPVLDADGNPNRYYEYVGMRNFSNVIEPDKLDASWDKAFNTDENLNVFEQLSVLYTEITKIEFWGALEFTLLYTFTTLPIILIVGFVIAYSVNTMFQRIRGLFVFMSLLPFIITPVVGALSIYWLFLDDAIVAALLQELGFGKFYFLSDKWTIRWLIIFYGIWHTAPFAFVVFFAGLQSIPQDSLEAADIDGANTWHKIRFVIIPFIMPLVVFVTLIHVMDAYRVFEPILVFGSALFADSLQHLTYYIIAEESNYGKAAASALLTVVGIIILLIPVLRRTWREQKGLV